jgi:hypothetical protein
MPNASANYRPYSNDTFVILHIDLPKAYIVAAEDRLTSALIKNMYDNNYEKFTFSISFSRIFFAENKDLSLLINENSRIKISYNGNEYDLYISSFSYTLDNNSPLPEVVVELTDKLSTSQNSINDAISETKSEILSKIDNSTHWMDIQGKPSWITSQKPTYSYNELTGTPNISGGSGGGYWELKTTESGEQYIFSKLNVVVQKGVTSYADDSDLDLPSIYDGLVIDNQTIYWDEIKEETGTDEEGNPIYKTTKVLKAQGGNGENSGGGGVGSVSWSDIEGKPSWLTDNKISYSEIEGTPDLAIFATEDYVKAVTTSSIAGLASESWVLEQIAGLEGGGTIDLSSYAEKTWVSSNFASLGEANTFTKANNFNGGLFVNGKEIKYNSDGYWVLEGDLLVTGDITSFASASGFTPSTVMDGVVVDGTTIIKQDGKLVVVGGGSSGGVADSVAWGNILGKPSWIGDIKPSYSYSEISGTPDLSKYLTSHQTIYDLTFQSGQFTADTFDPNGSAKTIKIPTTTAHISESSNRLYFTNQRAIDALKDTLTNYVDLTTNQEIGGEKNFTGSLMVNGGKIEYNDEDGYFIIDGDLLVTGGITAFSTGVDSSTKLDEAVRRLDAIKSGLSGITSSSTSSAIGSALRTIYNNI